MKAMEITKDSILGDILDQYPDAVDAFLEVGMFCFGCPHSRGESLEQACLVHGVDLDLLLAKLIEISKKGK